jgi:DNA-binding NarL/FixJ family response regulator
MATRIIKREMPSIQIVVVGGQDALREALSAGASGFLTKSEVGGAFDHRSPKVPTIESFGSVLASR